MKTRFIQAFGSRILASSVVAVIAEREGCFFSVIVQYIAGKECKSISSFYDIWSDAVKAAGTIADEVDKVLLSGEEQ